MVMFILYYLYSSTSAVMHKICNIIFAMLRDNKPFEIITPKEHCIRYVAEHPETVNKAAWWLMETVLKHPYQ
jgi:hypothetical protein